jgi:hypothetical protein
MAIKETGSFVGSGTRKEGCLIPSSIMSEGTSMRKVLVRRVKLQS